MTDRRAGHPGGSSCSSRRTTSARTSRASSSGCAPRCRPSTSSCSTTTLPTAPARSPTTSPPTTPRCTSLHRPGKQGLGAAYLAGFAWALDRGYDAAVEMDADGSHQPEQLPALLDAARATPTSSSARAGSRGGTRRQLAAVAAGPQRRRQRLRPGPARHVGPRRDGRLPRLPGVGPAPDGPPLGRVAGLRLPGRHDLAGRAVPG